MRADLATTAGGTASVLRYAAFSSTPTGGNPAGVALDATGLADADLQRIAADVGYSETAFLTDPVRAGSPARVRYFAPEGEVDFCGHATLATAVALGEVHGPGTYDLVTNVGPVPVTSSEEEGVLVGSMESPPVSCRAISGEDLAALLATLGWEEGHLLPGHPPAVGHGGNDHPVLVVRDLDTLAGLSYDFEALQRLCRDRGWVTIQCVTPTGRGRWRARDPFPYGGVVEDPATGAAAAAFAGYLRAQGHLAVGDELVIEQGVEMGRPSTLAVQLAGEVARISGAATRIEG